MILFTKKIISWYGQNKRELPWRETKDPYKIWVSEIILQQTRVEQGLPYYQRFIERFPTIESLATSPISDVLLLWQGLGYYSRGRNMHETAKIIVSEFKGNFPTEYSEIIKLKGIGKYTSAAISSFAFKQYTPVVDGNVIRFITRYSGIYENSKSRIVINNIEKFLTEQIIQTQNPDIFNQAIMEFGALVCTPKEPSCNLCVFKHYCTAYKDNRVKETPISSQKKSKKDRFFNYLLVLGEKEQRIFTFIQKREKNDIWQGLFEFPLFEIENPTKKDILTYFGLNPHYSRKITKQKSIIHILSHQKIHASFWVLQNVNLLDIKSQFKQYDCVELIDVIQNPFPVLITNFIKDLETSSKFSH